MGSICEGFSILLIVVLATSSIMIFETARAQNTPPIPEFSINFEDRQTVTVTIKNNGYTGYFFFNIRAKDHFGDNWKEFFNANTYTSANPRGFISPSSTEITTVNLSVNYAPGSQVDFQTEVIQYRESSVWFPDPFWAQTPEGGHYEQRITHTVTSGWGNTQTITIPEPSTSSPTPPVPEFSWLMILPLFFSMLSLVFLIKRRKTSWINANHL
jgi:hypothetical protein